MEQNKNYGLNIQKEITDSADTDYKYGAFSPVPVITIPESLKAMYLPKGEVQRGREDFMDCSARGSLNRMEADFTYFYATTMAPENKKWMEDNGYVNDGKITFSDRFISVLSGTTREGNSAKAPLQAMNDYGLIPKKLLPAESWMTFNDYQDPSKITQELKNLGAEFNKHFKISYDKVYSIHFAEVLGNGEMLVLIGYAWPAPVNGEYPRVEFDFNHFFVGVWLPSTYIFDNYIDIVDGDFIKKLASNYKFYPYGYRVFISAEYTTLTPERINWLSDIIVRLNSALTDLLGLLKQKATGIFKRLILDYLTH